MYKSWADCQRAETHARGTEQQAWPHFISDTIPFLSHISSVSFCHSSGRQSKKSLPLSSEAVTDHRWNINQRKCLINGRKLQGSSVDFAMGLSSGHRSCVCVCVGKKMICIANHPAPELASGVYNKSKSGTKTKCCCLQPSQNNWATTQFTAAWWHLRGSKCQIW